MTLRIFGDRVAGAEPGLPLLVRTALLLGGAVLLLVWMLHQNGLMPCVGPWSARMLGRRLAQALLLFCGLVALEAAFGLVPAWNGWRPHSLAAAGIPPGGGLLTDAAWALARAVYTEAFYRLYMISTIAALSGKWWVGALAQALLYATMRGWDGGWWPMFCTGLLLAGAFRAFRSVSVLVAATTLWDWTSMLTSAP